MIEARNSKVLGNKGWTTVS